MRPPEWEGIFDALSDPVLVLDDWGIALHANRSLRDALTSGRTGELGLHWKTLTGSEGPPGSCPIERCLASREAEAGEHTYAHLPGVWRVAASPVRRESGDGAGVVAVFHDVTAAHRQREQVFEAARLAEIGQLAGGIAHEINTPLASIALRAESLLARCADPELKRAAAFERFPRYLETIDREIFRCKRIIASLLEFARSGHAQVESTDLNALLVAAIDLVGHSARRKGSAVETRFDPELPRVEADPGQLRQVALALLVNAVDASEVGGAVVVTTGTAPGDEVFLEVVDQGPGVAEEDRERIFAPFYTTKRSSRGTGLGLAVCRQVLAAHGGRIAVDESTAGGARFRVFLPLRVEAREELG